MLSITRYIFQFLNNILLLVNIFFELFIQKYINIICFSTISISKMPLIFLEYSFQNCFTFLLFNWFKTFELIHLWVNIYHTFNFEIAFGFDLYIISSVNFGLKSANVKPVFLHVYEKDIFISIKSQCKKLWFVLYVDCFVLKQKHNKFW